MKRLLTLLLLILVGLNLRPVMATIGPLTDVLLNLWQLNYSWISLLNGLPILMMGAGALCSHWLLRHYSPRALLASALLLIAIGTLWRFYSQAPLLMIASALLAGLGIALVQAFMPSIIKQHWPSHTASYMGIYISAIMGGAALSAAIAPQILHHSTLGWALASWGLLALPTLWLFLRLVPRQPLSSPGSMAAPQAKPALKIYKLPRAWRLAAFFGLGTSGFTCMLAWLPPHFLDLGYSPTQAGLALSLLSATEVVSGLVFSQLAARALDRRPCLIAAILLAIIGLLCLALGQHWLAWAGVVIAGCGVGALFPLSMIVCMDHLEQPRAAGMLTAWVQGMGYLVAGTSPMLAGLLRDHLHSFTATWCALAGIMLILLPLAAGFDPRHYARVMSKVSA